jgi:hypothetical protein
MTEADRTCSIWQAPLNACAWPLTCRGFHHFAKWITAMAIDVEEHTITESVLALDQAVARKALESFAENHSSRKRGRRSDGGGMRRAGIVHYFVEPTE